jgi:hypothetical protein
MGMRMLKDFEISGDRCGTKKEAEKIIKYIDPTIEIKPCGMQKNKSDTNHNGSNWKNLKIIQKTRGNVKGKHEI